MQTKLAQRAAAGDAMRAFVHVIDVATPDVFDANLIWERPKPLLRDRNGLRHALDTCRRERTNGRSTVFKHVEIILPEEQVRHDRRILGGRRSALERDLAVLHAHSFGEDEARYRVIGGRGMPTGTVRVRFGHAVFVSGEEDVPAWKIELGRAFRAEQQIQLQAGQRLAVFGSGDGATLAVDHWPFPGCQLIVLNEPGAAELEFDVEPPGALQVLPDPRMPGWQRISPAGTESQASDHFYLRASRLSTHADPTLAPPAGSEAEEGHGHPAEDCQARLQLIAVLLPDPTAFQGETDAAEGITLNFDEAGSLQPPNELQSDRGVQIRCGRNSSAVEVRIGSQGYRTAAPDAVLAFADRHVTLAPWPQGLPGAGALLPLPQVIELLLRRGPQSLGRISVTLAAALRAAGALSRYGLSRQHCSVEPALEGLVFIPHGCSVVHELASDLGSVTRTYDRAEKPSWMLDHDGVVALGPFILRYQRAGECHEAA